MNAAHDKIYRAVNNAEKGRNLVERKSKLVNIEGEDRVICLVCNDFQSEVIPPATGKGDKVRTSNALTARNEFKTHYKKMHKVKVDVSSLVYPQLPPEEVNQYFKNNICLKCNLLIEAPSKWISDRKRQHLLNVHVIKTFGGCRICNLVFSHSSIKSSHYDDGKCKAISSKNVYVEPILIKRPKRILKTTIQNLERLDYFYDCGLVFYNQVSKFNHKSSNCKRILR